MNRVVQVQEDIEMEDQHNLLFKEQLVKDQTVEQMDHHKIIVLEEEVVLELLVVMLQTLRVELVALV